MDSISKLKNLYELKEKGVITQAEYEEYSKTLLLQKQGDVGTLVPQKRGTMDNRKVVYLKSRNIYVLLACMLGPLGIHNFYIGRNKRGIWQIVCLFLSWLVIPYIALTIWIFVDMLTVKTDAANEDMVPLNGWGLFLIIGQVCVFAFFGFLLIGAVFSAFAA